MFRRFKFELGDYYIREGIVTKGVVCALKNIGLNAVRLGWPRLG